MNLPRRMGALPWLLAGALGGVVVTATVMRPRTPPAVVAPAGHGEDADEHGDEHGDEHAEGEARIVLTPEARRTAGIRVEPVVRRRLAAEITVPGTVEVTPGGAARVTAPAAAQVTRIMVRPGSQVRAGQMLALLDSHEVAEAHAAERAAAAAVQTALAGVQTARADVAHAASGVKLAQAERDQAREALEGARAALARQRELAAAGAFAQAPLQAAQAELNEAQSDLLTAQTELQAHQAARERAERLYREELISRQDLEQAQLEYRQDQERVNRARARADTARQALERERRVSAADLRNREALQTAESAVRAAQGDVRRAEQSVDRARQEMRRTDRLESAARTALLGARSALEAARESLSALEGAAHRAGEGGLIAVAAPLDGTVTEMRATIGETVDRAATLFVVESLRSVVVEALVPEARSRAVRAGQRVEVTVAALPGRKFVGVVQRVGARVDARTRALPVYALVANTEGLLKPEMFARVHVPVGPTVDGLHVPAQAVDQDGEEAYVYVEHEGAFERTAVSLGRSAGDYVEVLDGLEGGERVAVGGVFVLKSESRKADLKGHEH